jgi:glycosyltransferase involved in cell wall biosynthesis
MKIGIESQRIFRLGKHGMDVVALELIRHLQSLDTINEYLLFAKDGPDKAGFTEKKNFHFNLVGGLTYGDWEQIALPRAIKKNKVDIIHCTANTAPLNCPVPLVLTLHDIIFLQETSFKGSPYQNFGNLYRRFVVPHVVKEAAKIITVSEYEKNVIADFCRVDSEKITVIHNAVDEKFHTGYNDEVLNGFRRKYDLPEQFILHLGNTAPKKNTERVIKAYIRYCLSVKHPLPIVIADFAGNLVERQLAQENKKDLLAHFHFPGYISIPDMPLLYNCSTLFLYPSLQESFGLPVLEAMACAVPVIASEIPALQEVAGDAVLYVDPVNVDAIADAVHSMLTNSTLSNSYKQKGPARAGQFSWNESAKKLLDVYITIMASP